MCKHLNNCEVDVSVHIRTTNPEAAHKCPQNECNIIDAYCGVQSSVYSFKPIYLRYVATDTDSRRI